MKAKIIGQNHSIIPYEVNGRKRYVIEDIEQTNSRMIVNNAIKEVGREWSKVYNWIDEWLSSDTSGGLRLEHDKQLLKAIASMTY
jgi:hypothetical protein